MSEYSAESRRIRAEQDRAYAESLAADRAKEKAKVYAYISCVCIYSSIPLHGCIKGNSWTVEKLSPGNILVITR